MFGKGEGKAQDISIANNYQRLQIAPNTDDTINCLAKFLESPPMSEPKLPTPVLSKDIPINQSKNPCVRIYLPRHALDHSSNLSSFITEDLSLAIGVGRDHEYCNPIMGESCKKLDRKAVGWRVLVTGWDRDPLVDRKIEVAKMLKEKGLHVVCHFVEVGHYKTFASAMANCSSGCGKGLASVVKGINKSTLEASTAHVGQVRGVQRQHARKLLADYVWVVSGSFA